MITCKQIPYQLISYNSLINVPIVYHPIHDYIKSLVAPLFGVEINDMHIPNKGVRSICEARHMAIYLVRKYCGYTQEITASVFNRDRSTLVNSNYSFENLIFSDKEYGKRLAICEEIIIKHLNSLV